MTDECMNWIIGKDPWITVVLDDGYVPVPGYVFLVDVSGVNNGSLLVH